MARKSAAAPSTPHSETPATQAAAQQAAPPDPVATAERVTNADLTSALEMQRLLRAEFAAGVDKSAELATIGAEIDGHRKKLTELAAIKKLRKEYESDEAKRARFNARLAGLQQAVDTARGVGAQSIELLRVLADVGARLKRIATERDAIRAKMVDALNAMGQEEHVAEGDHRRLRSALDSLVLPDHVLRELFTSGLGAVGVSLPASHFTINPPRAEWGTQPADQAVEKAVHELRVIGNKALNTLKAKEAA